MEDNEVMNSALENARGHLVELLGENAVTLREDLLSRLPDVVLEELSTIEDADAAIDLLNDVEGGFITGDFFKSNEKIEA